MAERADWRIRVHADLSELSPQAWNGLGAGDYPFLRYEFLRALETQGCLREYGWRPQHLTLQNEQGELLGASPLYLKANSYGEFVFDWAWADAYQRAGLDYYPKLVSTSPYTPATGPRLLVAPGQDAGRVEQALAQGAIGLAEQLDISSVHWLFTPDEQTNRLADSGLMRRTGCQFHWRNRGYRDFDDFLDRFSASKRKKVKRERRRVQEQGVELIRKRGDQVTDEEWRIYHQLYESTFLKRGGMPTLSLGFFQELARSMPEGVLLVLASYQGEIVAAAFNLVGKHGLYGRHWGCREAFHSLHFEACYYQGLEFAIEQGLALFEPGAQGEHKISRGFLPTPTWSLHWLAHPEFRRAVDRFLSDETEAMDDYMAELHGHSPYKQVDA